MNATLSYPQNHSLLTLSVECVVFGYDGTNLRVLLLQRTEEPFHDAWELPGGFVEIDESIDEAAYRKLRDKTGMEDLFLDQLYTFGHSKRDPRERVVCVAYYTLASLDARKQWKTISPVVAWHPIGDLPLMAFDHREIITHACLRLREKIRTEPVIFELLPPAFPLSMLLRLYETILGQTLDKRNFLRKLKGSGLVKDTGRKQTGAARRAPRLFRFDKAEYIRLTKSGYSFAL